MNSGTGPSSMYSRSGLPSSSTRSPQGLTLFQAFAKLFAVSSKSSTARALLVERLAQGGLEVPVEERAVAVEGHGADRAGVEGGRLRGAVVARHRVSRSQRAASFAWYVMRMSAPARRIEVSASRMAPRSSSQPLAAAAFSIAYSPETLYAASGSSVESRTARTTSR